MGFCGIGTHGLQPFACCSPGRFPFVHYGRRKGGGNGLLLRLNGHRLLVGGPTELRKSAFACCDSAPKRTRGVSAAFLKRQSRARAYRERHFERF
jgi:hypothetical protein